MEERLLATPHWRELTDRQLERAVTMAKQRGRQTAELIFAQAGEQNEPRLHERIANFDLYLNHCVKVVPHHEELVEAWGLKNAIEACDDPRMAWFCVVYQRTRWRLMGKPPVPKISLADLQKVKQRQFANVERAQYYYSMQAAAIHQQGGSLQESPYREQMRKLHREFMVQLDYAMLAVMTLNVATEEWITESGG